MYNVEKQFWKSTVKDLDMGWNKFELVFGTQIKIADRQLEKENDIIIL